MIVANVHEISKELRKAFEPLTGRQVRPLAASAINKTLAMDRVFIGREIRKEYRMNVFDAKSEIPLIPASARTLTGILKGNAGFTPMEYFSISGENNNTGSQFKLKRKGKYVMVNGKKTRVNTSSLGGETGRHSTFEVSISAGKTTVFTHAFMANTKNGPMLFNRGAYNARTNVWGSKSDKLPIDRLRTLSVWQEITSKKIVGKSELLLKTEYSREFLRLLNLRLSGQGACK